MTQSWNLQAIHSTVYNHYMQAFYDQNCLMNETSENHFYFLCYAGELRYVIVDK